MVSKAVKMAKVSAKGSFNLFWGVAISTIISSVGVILVANLLSRPENGLITIVLTAPYIIATFRDWGMNSAMIKFTAQYTSEKNPAKVKNIIVAGLLFELTLGLSLSLLCFLLSSFLATNIFQRPSITPLIQIASLIIFTGGLQISTQSVFTGYEKMQYTSILLILRSTLKTVLAPLFVILGLGVFGAILGTVTAFLIAGLISLLILYLTLHNKLNRLNNDKLEIIENIKLMFKYGLPLSISAIITGFLTQFYNILMAIYSSDQLIGDYSVATNFAVLITFFSTPIATVLFPAFSKINPRQEKETLRNVFQYSVKYAALLVVPAASIVMALSQPAISTLFGQKYTYAPLYLSLLAINHLYSALGNLSLGNFLNSQGMTRVNLIRTLITSAIGFTLSLLLIPRFGVIGLIVTILLAGLPSLVIGLWWIKKYFGITINLISSAQIILTSSAAAIITYIILSQINFSSWIKLILGVSFFLITYIIIISVTKTVDKNDISALREILRELGPLYPLFNSILTIIEKLVTVSSS